MTTSQSLFNSTGVSAASVPAIVALLAEEPVSALGMVCVTDAGSQSVALAFITVPDAGADDRFRHAIELEIDYLESELSFDAPEEPVYVAAGFNVDFEVAAKMVGVDQVVCLIVQMPDGRVAAMRDYAEVEVGLMDAAKEQLLRFLGMLPPAPIASWKEIVQ